MQRPRNAILMLGLLLAMPMANADPLPADHPIIGVWRVQVPGTTCEETYQFAANGTSQVTSAQERTESKVDISAAPNAKGFYKWADTVTKSNGKKDCMGETTAVGDTATNYILFLPGADTFLMCAEEQMSTCIGPFVRLKAV
jgi:hypothetical protein